MTAARSSISDGPGRCRGSASPSRHLSSSRSSGEGSRERADPSPADEEVGGHHGFERAGCGNVGDGRARSTFTPAARSALPASAACLAAQRRCSSPPRSGRGERRAWHGRHRAPPPSWSVAIGSGGLPPARVRPEAVPSAGASWPAHGDCGAEEDHATDLKRRTLANKRQREWCRAVGGRTRWPTSSRTAGSDAWPPRAAPATPAASATGGGDTASRGHGSAEENLEGAGEGVAGARGIPGLEPAREPFHAERRGAVRPLLRAAGAEGGRRRPGSRCILRRDRPARARRDRPLSCSHTPARQSACSSRRTDRSVEQGRIVLLLPADIRVDAEQVLHVDGRARGRARRPGRCRPARGWACGSSRKKPRSRSGVTAAGPWDRAEEDAATPHHPCRALDEDELRMLVSLPACGDLGTQYCCTSSRAR